MSIEFNFAKEILQCLKREFPEIIYVMGGIHPTISPEECLQYSQYVFIGESEFAVADFINAIREGKDVSDIPNLAYSKNGDIVINKPRPFADDLDLFPFPEHFPERSLILHRSKVLPLDKKLFNRYANYSGKILYVKTLRGCPYHCSYCCNSFFHNLYGKNKIRRHSVNYVINEIKNNVRHFPKIIYVSIEDEAFLAHDIEWIREFVFRYRNEINKKFICLCTPNQVTREKIELLKRAGLSWIYIGLQTGSENINNKLYRRRFSLERFMKAARIIHEHRIACRYDIIVDNPFETDEDCIETIRLLATMPKPYQLQIFSLCFYKGTELAKKAESENISIQDPLVKNYFKFNTRSIFNKIIRLCPVMHPSTVQYFIQHRSEPVTRFMIALLYSPVILLFESILWFRLILMSFDYNLANSAVMISSFLKKGINKAVLKKI